jgi:hypothetical protein
LHEVPKIAPGGFVFTCENELDASPPGQLSILCNLRFEPKIPTVLGHKPTRRRLSDGILLEGAVLNPAGKRRPGGLWRLGEEWQGQREPKHLNESEHAVSWLEQNLKAIRCEFSKGYQ